MDIQIITKDVEVVLTLSGRFDFHANKEFREAVAKAVDIAGIRSIEVDLGAVEYMDSSALGMLLSLREKARAANKDVALANCQGTVKQVLAIASFGKLFSIR